MDVVDVSDDEPDFFESDASSDVDGVVVGIDATAIPNGSIDMVLLPQINTLNRGGAHAIESRTHFDSTSLFERVIGETVQEFDGL